MPAANARALEKAKAIPCDAIIFDLEDAVAPDAKPLAREQAVAAVTSGEYGDARADDPLQRAVDAVGRRRPRRRRRGRAVRGRDPQGRLDRRRSTRSPPRSTPPAGTDTTIWAMVETPTAIFDVRAIAAHPRVACSCSAPTTSPRRSAPRSIPGRGNLTPYLATAVLGAREAGKVVLDGVYNDVRDAEGFAAECRQGVEMGFDGKTLVHPSQVEPANEAWSPTAEEIELARGSSTPTRRPRPRAAASSPSTAG